MLYLEQFGKAFVPERVRPSIRAYLAKAGIDGVPYKFFGGLFYATLLVTFITYFLFFYPIIEDKSAVAMLLLTFAFWFVFQAALSAFTIIVIYLYLNMRIYHRTKRMEVLFPDYLQLVSSNLKGGMTLDKALWNAIQPEFGVLAKEVRMVSKRVLTGNDLSEALVEFSRKYDSPILRRTIDLIVSEVEAGGSIAAVIDRIILNLRKVSVLKEEMAAQTVTYMVFVGAIVMLIAPALFALSAQLITIINSFASRMSEALAGTAVSIGTITIGTGTSVDVADFRVFSFFALGVISLFSAMIISIIEKGDIRGGLKYVPVFLVVSLVMYYVFTLILDHLFSGLVI